MGESKQRSRSRLAILASETRCIYCGEAPATLEHMPPIGMFRDRARPSGMEFATCADCNNGTSGADAVAAFFARLSPFDDAPPWRWEEARRQLPTLNRVAPGFHDEIAHRSHTEEVWMRRPSGLRARTVRLSADGPLTSAYLRTFGAKLGMALFREHCGRPLPLEGGVVAQAFLNGGLSQWYADKITSIMPAGCTLAQGSRNTALGQFFYRYNTDARTIVAALAQFHQGLYVATFALVDVERYSMLTNLGWGSFVRPGEVVGLMPQSRRAPAK